MSHMDRFVEMKSEHRRLPGARLPTVGAPELTMSLMLRRQSLRLARKCDADRRRGALTIRRSSGIWIYGNGRLLAKEVTIVPEGFHRATPDRMEYALTSVGVLS